MKPTKIKVEKDLLKISWKDDNISDIPLNLLRDECPCAGCKGETILWKKFDPLEKQNREAEGRYKIAAVSAVGGYAIQIKWEDGHDTGIYSWEYLIELNGKMNKT